MDTAGRWLRTTVLALVAVVACACSPAASDGAGDAAAAASPGTVAPPAGLSASLVQYRRDQPRRYVEVKLDNATDDALDVTLVGVTLPGFARVPDVNRTTHLEADRRVDLPVPLPEAVCDGPPDSAASARLQVTGGGAAVHTSVAVDDDGLLERLRTFDCAVRHADEAVDLQLAPAWRPQGSGADLTVAGQATATLRTDEPVEISDLSGGILFVAQNDQTRPPLPIRLDGGHRSTTIDFVLLPARCDGHAIAEARRLTTVVFTVSVDGSDPVPVRRAPDEAGYDTLVTALRERCGELTP